MCTKELPGDARSKPHKKLPFATVHGLKFVMPSDQDQDLILRHILFMFQGNPMIGTVNMALIRGGSQKGRFCLLFLPRLVSKLTEHYHTLFDSPMVTPYIV